MNTAIYPKDTQNVKAVTGSVFFHALLGAWVILGVLPKDIMPQPIPQAMNVTIVAMPPKEKMVQKPVVSSNYNKPEPKKIVQAVKPRIVHQKALPPIQKTVSKILPKIVAQKPPLPTYHKQPFKPVKQFIAKTESTTPTLQKQNMGGIASSSPLSARTPTTKNTQSAVSVKPVKTTAPLFDAAYLNNPSPDYPTSAKRRRMEGKVMLRVVVSSQGTAKSVRVTKSSGFDILDESAKNTVSNWRFVPARKGNQNIEAQIIVPIDFRLG